MKAEVLFDTKNQLGEGPVWDDRKKRLIWVDVDGCCIHVWYEGQKEIISTPTPSRPGCIVLREQGGFLVGLEDAIYALDEDMTTFSLYCSPKPLPRNRINDGKCAPDGRFFFGTLCMDFGTLEAEGASQLYRVDADGSIEEVVSHVTVSNGIAFDAQRKKMYYIDTYLHRVDAFDYNSDMGSIENRTTVIRIDPKEGNPDGMTIDTDGMLWIAYWGGGKVVRWNPFTGKPLTTISVPTPFVTCPIFGGDDLNELFITTARRPITVESKEGAGAVYHIKVDATGIPVARFR